MQQLQPFRHDLQGQRRCAREVAARPVQAGDKSKLDRVARYKKTIGMVVVAAFAAITEGVVPVAITAAWRRTKSASRSRLP